MKTGVDSRGAPKYKEVGRLLHSRIRSGTYPAGQRIPTEIELAQELKVNPLTVGRALKELVQAGLVVRRRGDGSYVTGRHPLIPGRHLRLGLLWNHSIYRERLWTTFQGAITRGALGVWGLSELEPEWSSGGEMDSTRATWSALGWSVRADGLGEAPKGTERHPDVDAVRAGKFDGLLCLSIIEEPWLRSILDLGIPTVLVDFPNERFANCADQVTVDPQTAYRSAVRHFAERGLRRIHFIGSLIRSTTPISETALPQAPVGAPSPMRVEPDTYSRQAAFRRGMEECGLPVSEENFHLVKFGREDLAALAERLLALPVERRPEAVLCHSVQQAEALITAFAGRGLPLSGAGASEHTYGGPALPIRADGMELGRIAAEMLLWKFQRPERAPIRAGVSMVLDLAGAEKLPGDRMIERTENRING